jgi:hypothetical protein
MDIDITLHQARIAAQAKDRYAARMILRKVIESDPNNLEAWLLFASVAQKPEHAEQCLKRVLKIEPGHETANQMLASLQGGDSNPDPYLIDPWNSIQRENDSRNSNNAGFFDYEQPGLESKLQYFFQPQSHVTSESATSFTMPPNPGPAPLPSSVPLEKPKSGGHLLERILLALVVMLIIVVLCGLAFVLLRNTPALAGLTSAQLTPANGDVLASLDENIRASSLPTTCTSRSRAPLGLYYITIQGLDALSLCCIQLTLIG